jgi:hypothetical protein
MVKTMNSTKQHKKVRLSGNDNCCVVLCSECNVLELNFGASTVRVNPESLQTISSILNSATVRLAQMQNAASVNDNAQSVSMKRVH